MRSARNSPRVSRRLRILLSCTVATVFLCGPTNFAPARAAERLIDRPAPEFVRTGMDGSRVDLAHYRGKVVLLNFWATWCAPCRTEIPRFASWQRQYGPQGLQIIGVSIDDSPAPVRALIAELHADYPIVMGDARLAEQYGGVLGVPVTCLIDRHGIIRGRFEGEVNLDALEARVRFLLASSAGH